MGVERPKFVNNKVIDGKQTTSILSNQNTDESSADPNKLSAQRHDSYQLSQQNIPKFGDNTLNIKASVNPADLDSRPNFFDSIPKKKRSSTDPGKVYQYNSDMEEQDMQKDQSENHTQTITDASVDFT